MITREIWKVLSEEKKFEELEKALQILYNIENKTHELYGKPEQGKLSSIKKNLENFIMATIDWEKEKI